MIVVGIRNLVHNKKKLKLFDGDIKISQTKKWWKDKKLLTGTIFVVVSIILGFYGKFVIISKIYEPIYWITGLSIWAFSWLVLWLGAFLIGWGTIKIVKQKIQGSMKKTIKTAYDKTKQLSGIQRRKDGENKK